jgi:hypothetical protein
MKLKLKSLVVALAMLGAGSAQAMLIDLDSWALGAGAATGDGNGDLWFSIFDPTSATSYIVDLNLSVQTFRDTNASLIDTFSVTNATLASFIAGASDTSVLQWNLGGFSNGPDFGAGHQIGTVTTNGASRDTFTGLPGDGDNLTVAMNKADGYVSRNNDLTNPTSDAAIVPAFSDFRGFMAGEWACSYGGSFGGNNCHVGLVGGEFLTYVYLGDGSVTGDVFRDPVGSQGFNAGMWTVNSAGTVSYVSAPSAVPVPAAVWLLGSGLLGLLGVSRRRS